MLDQCLHPAVKRSRYSVETPEEMEEQTMAKPLRAYRSGPGNLAFAIDDIPVRTIVKVLPRNR